jgi:phenylalanine-4-hydroxylase
MTMRDAAPTVPAHLRRFVVEQDYAAYTAVDQAVWRFVLLQTHARLVETAHPAYRDGLAATGLSVERIPRIAEMNEKLSRFGWGAVCVDGFIPPRAFQDFQACGILPIAADMRTPQHLVYTPAPDIIHEAAGHAPILPDPVFSAYLRRIGELGKKAFALPEDDRVYRAIHALSEAKEDPSLGADDVSRIEAEVAAAVEGAACPSEAARLSRLYWWTAEYGLVGRVDDYKIYGAGLLSSLGESHSCHAPGVAKRALDERCVEVGYDITRPQPQLFVARSFEALHDVLDRVGGGLAVARGGSVALEAAMRSRELASVHFSSGGCAMGVLVDVGPGLAAPGWLAFEGPGAFAWEGAIPGRDALRWTVGHCVVAGPLAGAGADGQGLEGRSDTAIDRHRDGATGRHRFAFASGVRVEGRLARGVRRPDGRVMHLEMDDVVLSLPGRPDQQMAHYALVAAGDPVTAHAGAAAPTFYPETVVTPTRVPRPRALPERERRLLSLYERAEEAHRTGAARVQSVFPRVLAVLDRDFPREWLLRWNLLESLIKAGDDGPVARALRSELERLEVELDHDQPIASGLRYLARAAA